MICETSLVLEENTIKYLQKQLKNNNFEVSGDFSIVKHDEENNIHYFGIGDILHKGTDEKVAKVKSRYSFHTHPEASYIKFSVTKGIPSNWDYLLFLKCYCDDKINTIFHIVVSLEGLYFISIAKEYANLIKKVSQRIEDFIMDNYGVDPPDDLDVYKYCRDMSKNKINNKRLISVQFCSWENVPDTRIKINYRPLDKIGCELK